MLARLAAAKGVAVLMLFGLTNSVTASIDVPAFRDGVVEEVERVEETAIRLVSRVERAIDDEGDDRVVSLRHHCIHGIVGNLTTVPFAITVRVSTGRLLADHNATFSLDTSTPRRFALVSLSPQSAEPDVTLVYVVNVGGLGAETGFPLARAPTRSSSPATDSRAPPTGAADPSPSPTP